MLQSCLIMSDYRFKGKPVLLCFLLHFSIVLIKDCIPCHFMRRCQRFNQSQNKLYDTRKCVSWWLERKGEQKKVCRLWLRGQHLSLPERHFNEPKICLVYSSCQHLIFLQTHKYEFQKSTKTNLANIFAAHEEKKFYKKSHLKISDGLVVFEMIARDLRAHIGDPN